MLKTITASAAVAVALAAPAAAWEGHVKREAACRGLLSAAKAERKGASWGCALRHFWAVSIVTSPDGRVSAARLNRLTCQRYMIGATM